MIVHHFSATHTILVVHRKRDFPVAGRFDLVGIGSGPTSTKHRQTWAMRQSVSRLTRLLTNGSNGQTSKDTCRADKFRPAGLFNRLFASYFYCDIHAIFEYCFGRQWKNRTPFVSMFILSLSSSSSPYSISLAHWWWRLVTSTRWRHFVVSETSLSLIFRLLNQKKERVHNYW